MELIKRIFLILVNKILSLNKMNNKTRQLNTFFDFAQDKDSAIRLYSQHKSADPLPKIKPALLNSADIAEYVCLTGMIFPFNPSRLKPASYEAIIGKEVWYWDNKKRKQYNKNLKESDSICFRQNSITYITLEETFQIPDYIALRFNLTIKHVHRGILLGTGPLIDPGFQGKIMIPIHNLTPNNYIVRPGDAIISIEFTKLSPNNIWNNETPKGKGDYVTNPMTPFPDFEKYFKKALPNGIRSVNSSIGNAIKESEDRISNYIKKINAFKSRITLGVLGAILSTLLVGIIPLLWYTLQSFNSSNAYVTSAEQYVIESNNKFNEELKNTVKQNIESFAGQKIQTAVKEIVYTNKKKYEDRLDQISSQQNRILKELERIIEKNNAIEKSNAELKNEIEKIRSPLETVGEPNEKK